jgi:hypothetical protein
LDELKVPYHRIDIDSFQYAKGNLGNKYRSALCDKTDCKTFPQMFLEGNFLGGAVDVCQMWKKGELQLLLKDAGVEYNDYEGDPFEFLPRWMSQNPFRDK